MTSDILIPGDTCWRIAHANRLSVIVDAADYYRAARAAILKAQRSVLLIGWDFDSRIELEPEGETLEGPNALGPFLSWIADRRPEVSIHLLKWNLGMIETLGRGETPFYMLQWMWKRNIRMKLDAAHPPLAAHHQKIVVVDDALAFCGGIDMTLGRWDTRAHKDDDPARRSPRGKPLQPWHDATICADGPLAAALGELARERWRRATDEELPPPSVAEDLWPDFLEPTMTDVDVGIARTVGAYDTVEQVCEIERLYLAAIARARNTLYIESQYFASRKIAEAIAARLQEPEGPEIVIINPDAQDGWLEETTMGSARSKLIRFVRRADRHGRFRIYFPQTAAGAPIYVHAKVMIVDDRLLKVGSSNLNNRSMGFDTESDLAVEARPGDDALRARIRWVRDDLLAEHLGVAAEDVARKIDEAGSLIAAIEAFAAAGRRLAPMEAREVGEIEDVLSENDLVDPERPPGFWRRARRKLRLR